MNMLKNLLIIIVFSVCIFLGTYWFLIKFGFGHDPRSDFCPVRLEEFIDESGEYLSFKAYYRSGKIETKDGGAHFVGKYLCNTPLERIEQVESEANLINP